MKVESVLVHSCYPHHFIKIEPKHLSYICSKQLSKLSAVGYCDNFLLLWIDAASHSPSNVSWVAVQCICRDYRRGFEKWQKQNYKHVYRISTGLENIFAMFF